MGLAALILLHHGMDVTKPPLERVVLEDRGGPGGVVERVDGVARLVDRPGRSKPDRRVVVEAEPAGTGGLVPDLVERAQQKGARRTDPRLGLRGLRLDHVVVAQGALGAARDLVTGQLDKSVEHAARDPSATPANPAE